MANSDYVTRGSGYICPSATLLNGIGPGKLTDIAISRYSSQNGALPAVGGAVLIGGEICKLVAVSATAISIARGCADTVPASHSGGTKVWFMEGAVGSDGREYMATETIGVKVLMKTAGNSMVPKQSPPNTLQFNQRFKRPYPPGLVTVNTDPFYTKKAIDATHQNLVLAWAHRDRITESDQLIDHSYSSIGPEVGTTYRLRIYKADELSPRATIEIGLDSTITLNLYDLVSILDAGSNKVEAHAELCSVRETIESWQFYPIYFTVDGGSIATGWGNSFGIAFGG